MINIKTLKSARVAIIFLTFFFIMCYIPAVFSAPTRWHFSTDLPALNRSLKFKCDKPQLRAYNLVDLMIYQGYSVRNERPHQPSYLVVHRCDGHAGCCNFENKICMPVKDSIYYEELEFEFLVIDSQNHSTTKRKTISIEQHRKCKCSVADYTEREDLEKERPSIKFV
ncbi:hypothetical protein PV327_007054 [Microctonus hyperodae]|uniref:Platelet-derived growth factor (PDGF) family profile domain-containing protein n=1 Tax=Microctonus hyperodae TaxID=165561 RepID=A0AA39F5J8_MICHY|nr:hypothetical protein PV327_007054 [Microctonus hyperodae]